LFGVVKVGITSAQRIPSDVIQKEKFRKKNSEKQKPGVRKINFYRLPPFLSDSAAEVKV
jgi:hypothetical protein